jgi:hypothetical protein
MGKSYRPYRNLLLIDRSEIELHKYKRVIDMFGAAENIQAETNGSSALYYLRNAPQLPELVVASIDKDPHFDLFVNEYEKLPFQLKLKSPLVLLYNTEEQEQLKWNHYPMLKKPLCVPELCDLRNWSLRMLN